MEGYKNYIKYFFDTLRLRPSIPQILNSGVFIKHFLFKKHKQTVTGYLPVSFGVYITSRCNLRCSFCYLDWKDSSVKNNDITVEEFRSLVEHPIFKGAVRITLAGGEPLQHQNLTDLLDIAFEKHLYSIIYSNGLLINKCHENLAKSKLNSISVSLYDDFLDKQLSNISMLMETNKKHKSKMVISLTKVISTDNYECIDKVLDIANQLGIRNIFFQNYYSSNPDESHKGIYDDNDNYKKFINKMHYKSREHKLNVIFPNLLIRNGCNLMCISLYSTISVDKNGNISPCCFIVPPSISYGNIFNDKDPWNTQFYKHLRGTFIGPPAAEYPKCKNCNLKTINSFKKVKFF